MIAVKGEDKDSWTAALEAYSLFLIVGFSYLMISKTWEPSLNSLLSLRLLTGLDKELLETLECKAVLCWAIQREDGILERLLSQSDIGCALVEVSEVIEQQLSIHSHIILPEQVLQLHVIWEKLILLSKILEILTSILHYQQLESS
jgi:hypothetical protein